MAMSTFSRVGSRRSKGMRMCACVRACTQAYVQSSLILETCSHCRNKNKQQSKTNKQRKRNNPPKQQQTNKKQTSNKTKNKKRKHPTTTTTTTTNTKSTRTEKSQFSLSLFFILLVAYMIPRSACTLFQRRTIA